MQRKMQRVTVGIIIGVICITLIGSSFVAIFQPDEGKTAEMQNQQILESEYEARKQVVEALNKKVQEDPEDTETLLALADAYYEKSEVTVRLNLNEYKEDLQKAIELYQKVIKETEDNSVKLKLATAAFYLGDSELAENTYNTVLRQEPENIDALFEYGLFLFYAKSDYGQAEANWQKALSLTTDDQFKKSLEEMIVLVQDIGVTNADEMKDKD